MHTVDATPDVNKLVVRLKEVIGTTWQAATTPNTSCTVVEGEGARRKAPPWDEVKAAFLLLKRKGQ